MTERSERQVGSSVDSERPGDEKGSRTWTFRGYRLDMPNFTTAMAHLYRGEVSRCNTWRTRLDATTNWAVITVGAALPFVFGAPHNPHFVLLLELLLVFTFLYVEARRYQYYALWSYRIRFMETNFFAAILSSPASASTEWADYLVDSLLRPAFPIPRWEAVARRFQRNYVWLTALLLVSWILKLIVHPTPAWDWSTVVERAAIGPLTGVQVMVAVGTMYLAVIALVVAAVTCQVWQVMFPASLQGLEERLRRITGPLLLKPRSRERLATIITSHGRQVALRLLEELGRGVTALEGRGMYTNEAREVLLCAVTDVQVPCLKRVVSQADPHAFVIVSPAEEVRGGGFQPFDVPS